jgi:hypothetical protein
MPRDGVEWPEHVGSCGAYVAYATIQASCDLAVGVFTISVAQGGAADRCAARL